MPVEKLILFEKRKWLKFRPPSMPDSLSNICPAFFDSTALFMVPQMKSVTFGFSRSLLFVCLFAFSLGMYPFAQWGFQCDSLHAAETETAEQLSKLYLIDGRDFTGSLQARSEEGVLWKTDTGKELSYPDMMVDRIELLSSEVDEALTKTVEGEKEAESEPDDKVVNASATVEEIPEAPGVPEELAASDQVDTEIPPPLTRVYRYTARRMKRWTKRFELGGRFVDGNSEERFLNTEARFETRCDHYTTRLDMGGKWGETPAAKTANNWYANGTADFGEVNDWIIFATSQNQYDELQGLDYRGTLSAGIGYRFADDDCCRAIVRIGPGVTYEKFMGSDEDRVTADIFGEAEYHKQLWERLKFEGKSTLKPSIDDLDVFRLINDWAWLTTLDEDSEWQFKVSLRVEYNSEPAEDREKTDYTTLVGLVYTLK